MVVTTTWIDPDTAYASGGLDVTAAVDDVEAEWADRAASDLYRLGGDDGNAKTGKYQIGAATSFSNANMTQGLTINQSANDDEILALKSSDVAHGVTTFAETDTYGYAKKLAGATGGLQIVGLAEPAVEVGVQIAGVAGTDATGKASTSAAYVIVDAYKSNGTTTQALGANANVFAVRSGSSNKLLVDQEGDLHVDGSTTLTAFDEWDDALLVRAASRELTPVGLVRDAYDEFVRYGRRDLEAAGLVRFNEDTDGVPFVNVTGFVRLLCGSTWQLAKRLMALEARLLPPGGN